jgi:hypothetical protein
MDKKAPMSCVYGYSFFSFFFSSFNVFFFFLHHPREPFALRNNPFPENATTGKSE